MRSLRGCIDRGNLIENPEIASSRPGGIRNDNSLYRDLGVGCRLRLDSPVWYTYNKGEDGFLFPFETISMGGREK
jgi:hypothetical protein